MSYTINKTDGSVLSVVPDGQIDTLSTSITLIGRNYSGFGEALNENFIKLLENFSSSIRPDRPIVGQLWYDSNEKKLKVFTGESFSPVSSATVSNYQPSSLTPGDLWFDDINKQLFFFDGQGMVLVGPMYAANQGRSGFNVRTVTDTRLTTRVILELFSNDELLGVFSNDEFVPKDTIIGFNDTDQDRVIRKGFSAADTENFKIYATAENSEKLGNVSSSRYARRDTDNVFTGQLSITNNAGIVLGDGLQGVIEVDAGNLIISNSSPNKAVAIKLRKDAESETAVAINSFARSIDLYNGFSDSHVTIGGHLTVKGNFAVEGNLTSVNTQNLEVEDQQIELGKTSQPTDITADNGGIVLKGTTDHSIVWTSDSKAWNFSEHVNLVSSSSVALPEFKINGITVLSATSLGSSITSIPGVTRFGTQTEITVGPRLPSDSVPVPYLRIKDNRISTLQENQDLEFETTGQGNIVLTNKCKVIGVRTTNQDTIEHTIESWTRMSIDEQSEATNKKYVSHLVRTRPIVFSMNVSDNISNSEIAELLTQMAPPAEYEDGTIARILCTSQTNTGITVNLNPLLSKDNSVGFNTPVGVDYPLHDVALSPLNVPPQPVVLRRVVKTFELVASTWAFVS